MSRPVFSCITSILNKHPRHAHLLCTVSGLPTIGLSFPLPYLENQLTQSPPFPLFVSTINLSSSLSNPTQNGSRHLHNVYRTALVAENDCKAGNDDTVIAGPQLADGRIYVDQRRHNGVKNQNVPRTAFVVLVTRSNQQPRISEVLLRHNAEDQKAHTLRGREYALIGTSTLAV